MKKARHTYSSPITEVVAINIRESLADDTIPVGESEETTQWAKPANPFFDDIEAEDWDAWEQDYSTPEAWE